jgi:hypothetical protein
MGINYHQVKIKNADLFVIVDDQGYQFIMTDEQMLSLNLAENLRLHSSGCIFFQKTIKISHSNYKTTTIYLHKLLAETFKLNEKTKINNLVGFVNGNKLDCRLNNLIFRSRAVASRTRKTSSSTGFTGVYKEHNKFRSVISIGGKSRHLGMFRTAEEAAKAFNEMSKKLYGDEGKQNILDQ